MLNSSKQLANSDADDVITSSAAVRPQKIPTIIMMMMSHDSWVNHTV